MKSEKIVFGQRTLLCTLFALLLCLALPLCARADWTPVNTDPSEFDFSKEPGTELLHADEEVFDRPFYSLNKLPSGVTLSVSSRGFPTWLCGENPDYRPEIIIKARVDMVSGDESLAGAVDLVRDDSGEIFFSVNTEQIMVHDPCEAVFRITAESEHMVMQRDSTIRIIAFAEDPPFVLPEEPLEFQMVTGHSIGYRKLKDQLLGGIVAEKWIGHAQWHKGPWMKEGELVKLEYDMENTEDKITAVAPGTSKSTLRFSVASLQANVPIRFEVVDYEIRGPETLGPGDEYRYTVSGGGDRTFTWSVEYDGSVEIDPETGLLKIAADEPGKKTGTITAAPDDGGTPAVLKFRIEEPLYAEHPNYLYGNAMPDEFDVTKERLDTLNSGAESRTFCGPWYIQDGLPDGISPKYRASGYLYLGQDSDDVSFESSIDRYMLEYVSGSPDVKNAVQMEEHKDEEGKLTDVSVRIMPEQVSGPCEAVFRLTLENEKYYYQKELTIRFILFGEDRPFAVPDVPLILHGQKGNSFSLYSRGRGNISNSLISSILLNGNADGFMLDRPAMNRLKPFDVPYLQYNENTGYYTLMEEGEFDLSIPYTYSNLSFSIPVRFCVSDYYISGSRQVTPGAGVQYEVVNAEGKAFTWSVEGEGASIDAETGLLSVNPDAELESRLMIHAVPADGGVGASYDVQIAQLGFAYADLSGKESKGFTFPVYSGTAMPPKELQYGSPLVWRSAATVDGVLNQQSVETYINKTFVSDEAGAQAYFTEMENTAEDLQEKQIMIDGSPALLRSYTAENGEGWNLRCGEIWYPRYDRTLHVQLLAGRKKENIDDIEPFSLEQLEELASMIHFDESKAELKPEDVQLAISSDAGTVLNAGGKAVFTATFGNPEKVNGEIGNNSVTWTVTDAEGGETKAAEIKPDGSLAVAKKLDAPCTVRVTATSDKFGTSAFTDLTLYPAVTKVETDPKELFLYAGSDAEVTVRAVLFPEGVPAHDIQWKAQKEGFAEITAHEDGSASFKALKAGKTGVTVTEPGGKKYTLKLNVVEPVTDIELTLSGKPKPGGSVTVKYTLLPKTAGKKDVEWSLDVGGDIATVSKGKVKISKDAAPGTVITVTCTAAGAPEPVVRTIQIEVAEK